MQDILEALPTNNPKKIAALLSCLNNQGFLVHDLIIPSTPAKRKLVFSELNEANSQEFCFEAADTIAKNICMACAHPSSSFFEGPMKTCLEDICRIYARGSRRSVICLSLLVHASKCSSNQEFKLFVSFVACAYKNKSFPIDVPPPACFEQAKRFPFAPSLSSILLQNLHSLRL